MNRPACVVSVVLLLLLMACAPAVRPVQPVASEMSTLPAPPTGAASSFVPTTYRDEVNGFELDYPTDWSLDPNTQVGTRGSQAQLLSPGTTSEMLAQGGSRLSITLYDWDPKNDLAAYVVHRRAAWDASGFNVLDASLTQLVDGRPASDFFIAAPDGVHAYFLLTTNGAQYLQLAGEGNLSLVEAICRTLRPLNFKPQ